MKKHLLFLLSIFICTAFAAKSQTWVTVGSGTNNFVNTMIVDSSDYSLIIGGKFTGTGGFTANHIAKWDGGSWSTFASGMNGDVNALILFNSQLVAGGSFTTAGGVPSQGVASWNGTNWLLMNSGLAPNAIIYSFCIFSNELYAATNAGLKKWTGSTWIKQGPEVTGPVYALAVYKGAIYAGGDFNIASGDGFDRIAKWNGSAWSGAGSSGADSVIKALCVFNGDLYMGGHFTTVNGVSVSGSAKWDNAAWSAPGTGSLPGEYAYLVYQNALYAYGNFTGAPASTFRKLNAGAWQPLSFSVNSFIRSFAIYNNEIYAGGEFTFLEGGLVPLPYIARFTNQPLTVYKTSSNVKCFGGNDGFIKSTGYGGTAPYTYLWSNTAATSTITGLTLGTYNVTVTDAVSQTATASVVINQPALLTVNVTTTANSCDGSACATGAGGSPGYSYAWSPATSAGQNASCMTGSIGNYVVTVTDSKQCQATASASLTSTSNIPTGSVIVGGPTTFCQGDSVSLTAEPGNNYKWSDGRITQVIEAKISGSYTVTVTSSGGCSAVSSPVTVTVKPLPVTAITSGPLTICQFDSVTFSTPLNAGYSYEWQLNMSPIGSATANTYVAKLAGDYRVRAYNTCGSDISPTKTVVVNVTPPPTVTSPVKYCLNDAAVPLTATGTGLIWYTAATGGAGSATAPTPVTTSGGTTSHYVSRKQGGCESVRVQLDVIVYNTPPPVVTSPVNYCLNASASALTATGSNLLWYAVATGGTGSAAAPTPTTTVGGAFSFWVSQTQNTCEGPRANITVNVFDTPAPTVKDTGYCQNSSPAPLTATGSNLLWYTASTGGTGSSTAPVASTTTNGVQTYYVSQSLNGCEGPRAAIKVTISTVSAPITSPVAFCQGAVTTCLTAIGTNLLWYPASSGGGGIACLVPSTVAAGTTTYYVSQTSNGCESPRAGLDVTVKPNPAAPTVTTPVTYCKGVSSVALSAGGTSLLWYAVANGGVGSASAPVPSTAAPGQKTVYVSQTVNGCEGPRASILIKVLSVPKPIISASGATNICKGKTVTLNASGAGTSDTYKWSSGPTTASISVSQGGAYYVVLTTPAGCKDSSSKITVVVNTITTPTVTGSGPLTFCKGKNVILQTTPTYVGYKWSTGTTSPRDTIKDSGTYSVIVNDNLGCTSLSVPVTVKVDTMPYVQLTESGPLIFCEGDSVVLTVVGSYAKYKWTDGTTAGSTKIKISSPVQVNTVDAGGCTAKSAPRTVTVNPRPTPVITRVGALLSSKSANSYQWRKNRISISGANKQDYLVSSNGSYSVVITNSYGCSVESDTLNLSFVGINEIEAERMFMIHPNPFEGLSKVEYTVETSANVSLEVYNLIGAKVLTLVSKERQGKGIYSYPLDGSKLDKAGVYFIRLTLGDQVYMKKVTKL